MCIFVYAGVCVIKTGEWLQQDFAIVGIYSVRYLFRWHHNTSTRVQENSNRSIISALQRLRVCDISCDLPSSMLYRVAQSKYECECSAVQNILATPHVDVGVKERSTPTILIMNHVCVCVCVRVAGAIFYVSVQALRALLISPSTC